MDMSTAPTLSPMAMPSMPSMPTDDSMSTTMIMQMTFKSWSSFQTKILFETWNVQTKMEFAFSWLCVCTAGIVWHWLSQQVQEQKKVLLCLQNSPVSRSSEAQSSEIEIRASSDYLPHSEAGRQMSASPLDDPLLNHAVKQSYLSRIGFGYPKSRERMRAMRAFTVGVRYGLGLFMMLVAMTFNPWLFVALVVGFMLGEYIFEDS